MNSVKIDCDPSPARGALEVLFESLDWDNPFSTLLVPVNCAKTTVEPITATVRDDSPDPLVVELAGGAVGGDPIVLNFFPGGSELPVPADCQNQIGDILDTFDESCQVTGIEIGTSR